MTGFAITIKMVSSHFDTKKIIRAAERAERRVGTKAGAFVRRGAKSSIRKSKKVSKPGRPPRSHSGQLKTLLLFGYDAGSKTTVVGFKPTRSGGAIPQALEKGGTTKVTIRKRGRKVTRTVRIAKRPTLVPALEKERSKLPGRWANSIKA